MRNSKGFGLLSILIIVVVIGVIGLVGWVFFTRQDNAVNKEQQTNTTTLQPEDVIKKIKDEYAKKYTLLNLDENNQPASGQMSIKESETSPVYKPDGYSFYTDYDGGSTLYILPGPVSASNPLPSEVDTIVRQEIATIYTDFGLSKTTETRVIGDDVYVGKGLICTIENPITAISSTRASCGLIDAYKQAAEKINPLAAVIPNVSSSTAFTGLKITDSEVNGYQKAYVNVSAINEIGGSSALLYKKGSEPWVYFRNTQEIIPCSYYNSSDLKNAFKGDSCYDINSQALIVL